MLTCDIRHFDKLGLCPYAAYRADGPNHLGSKYRLFYKLGCVALRAPNRLHHLRSIYSLLDS